MCFAEQERRPISSVPISVTEAEMCRQCLEFMKIFNSLQRFAMFAPILQIAMFTSTSVELFIVRRGRPGPISGRWPTIKLVKVAAIVIQYTHTYKNSYAHTHTCVQVYIHTYFWLYTAVSGRTDWIRQITTTTPRALLLLESGADKNIESQCSRWQWPKHSM